MEFARKEEATLFHKTLASLSPPVAMFQTITVLARFEESGVGIRWSNIHAEFRDYSVERGLIMCGINCAWLMLLGIYLEQVMPKTIGTRRHPLFFLQPSFWREFFNCKASSMNRHNTTTRVHDLNQSERPLQYASSERSFQQNTTQKQMFEDIESTQEFETKYLNPQCYEKV